MEFGAKLLNELIAVIGKVLSYALAANFVFFVNEIKFGIDVQGSKFLLRYFANWFYKYNMLCPRGLWFLSTTTAQRLRPLLGIIKISSSFQNCWSGDLSLLDFSSFLLIRR